MRGGYEKNCLYFDDSNLAGWRRSRRDVCTFLCSGLWYPPPPTDLYASPWAGPDTPWVYYNGDWFLNGVLYYFFGPTTRSAPHYAYAPSYVVRPGTWYAPRWMAWYQGQPQYLESFQRQYPYWRGHHQGQRYSQKFYEQHHGGQGGGWQKGVQGHPAAPSSPQARKPGPAKAPPPERQQPAVKHEQRPQPQQQRPAVQQRQKLQTARTSTTTAASCRATRV